VQGVKGNMEAQKVNRRIAVGIRSQINRGNGPKHLGRKLKISIKIIKKKMLKKKMMMARRRKRKKRNMKKVDLEKEILKRLEYFRETAFLKGIKHAQKRKILIK